MYYEKGTRAERLLDLIRGAGHNEEVIASRGEVVDDAPLAVYVAQLDMTISDEGLDINPALLAREEDVAARVNGELQTITLQHASKLEIGTDVYTVTNTKTGVTTVVCRLTTPNV